jgi:hypothetical protein
MQQYTQKNYIYYNIPFICVEDKHIYRHIETNWIIKLWLYILVWNLYVNYIDFLKKKCKHNIHTQNTHTKQHTHLHSHPHKKNTLSPSHKKMNIQTILILKIVICTTHKNIYDLHVMTYNSMYSFQHTFVKIHINNKIYK